MKTKLTLNDNVKITLTKDEAARLRSILAESISLARNDDITETTKDLGLDLCAGLFDLGVGMTV